jgi:Flp pilus assembly protein TadG
MENLCHSKKGQVLILFVMAIFVLLAIAGLAVDVGMAYIVKTKLNAAVDAAALAAGRVVSQSDTNAPGVEASKFFKTNYPADLLGAKVSDPTTTAVYNADRTWTVTVTATAAAPTYFTKAVVGWQSFAVGASATSTIYPVDLMLVVDCSYSLGPLYSTVDNMPALRDAATRFIKNFNVTNDRIGLIHFASGSILDVPITVSRGFSQTAITKTINAKDAGNEYVFKAFGTTNAEEAMRIAQQQLDLIPADQQSSLRVIVFFTDGAPNGIAGKFSGTTGSLYSEVDRPGRATSLLKIDELYSFIQNPPAIPNLPDTDYTGKINLASYNNIRAFVPNSTPIVNTTCNANKAARNMVENVANAARSESGIPIHIFTIGLGDYMNRLEIDQDKMDCGYGSNEIGSNILKRLANVPGVDTHNPSQPEGVYAYAPDSTQLNAAFDAIAKAILRLSK